MRLLRALPSLADELHSGFQDIGRYDLAAQIAGLELVDRCRCGDSFCATFYTQPKDIAYSRSEAEELIIPMKGLMCIQIVRKQIAWVELLSRPDVRAQLQSLLP